MTGNGKMSVTISRVTAPGSLAQLAGLAAQVIGADTRYISHGEIQTGLSDDATHWSPDLAALFAEDFVRLDDSRSVLAAFDENGVPQGFAVVAWEETPRRTFAVLEDMIVVPLARSLGIGAQLLRAVEQSVAARGVTWLFLESGRRNERAHIFFERHGFAMTSHVFAKKLG